ncbi:MAG: hypothetical protein ACK5OC_16370 [Pirellula sp.]
MKACRLKNLAFLWTDLERIAPSRCDFHFHQP